MLLFGTSVVFDELPVTVRLPAAVSGSPTVNASAPVGVSSLTVWFATAEMVGGSFTAPTVTVNAVAVEVVPSLTVNVMVAVPDWLAAGVTVTVRFAPLPPNTMLAFGTSVVFAELPETVRLAAAGSASAIADARADVPGFRLMF